MDRHCYGCGASLQDTDTKSAGYINNLENDEHLLCQRCFRMKNYNEYHSHYLSASHFKDIIKKTVKKGNLVILVVDLFDLSSAFNQEVCQMLKQNPVIIVGSKRDLILKSIKDKKIIMYLYQMAKQYQLDVRDVIVSSASKKQGIDDLLDSIFEYYRKRDVYIVGVTNAGKSSIVNALINSIEKSEHQITISNYPGTTLDSIKIELDSSSFLYDTPGLVVASQMIHALPLSDYKYLQVKKEVKARNYQLNEGQSLFLGGLVCFSFISGEKTSFTCFANNDLVIHRTKYEKREELFDSHYQDDLLNPRLKEIIEFADFKLQRFDFNKIKGKKDIVILGLGWLSLEANNQIIEVALPCGVQVLVRDALI